MTIEVLKTVDSEDMTKYKYPDRENRFHAIVTEGINHIKFKDSSGNLIPEK